MRRENNNPVRGVDYEKYIPGEMELSSSSLSLKSNYVGWHTQPREPMESFRPATAEHQFVLYFSDEEVGEYQYNHGGWRAYRKRRNDWFIAPAIENEIHWKPRSGETSQRPCIFRIHLTPELLHLKSVEFFGRSCVVVHIDHRMNIQDPVMTGLACGLKEELAAPSAGSLLYIEHVFSFFALHILRRYCKIEYKSYSKVPKLSRRRCEQVEEYVASNLMGDIALDDMACVACLSKYYFLRAFKESFNMTPYQYVMNRRVREAAYLLSTTDLPVGLVSEYCGFGSLSSFSKTFSRLMKISPRAYRAKTTN